jgi:hypothetical protein
VSKRTSCFLFCALLLVCATFADSQNVRWDLGTPGGVGAVTASSTSGEPFVIAIPGVVLNWCNYPANAVPCTNFANTYPSISSSTPCPTNTPIVLQGSSSCVGSGDNFGNLGVYVPAGNYAYTLTIGGASSGPFVVSLGGGGSSGIPGVVPRASVCPANNDPVQSGDRLGYVSWSDAGACTVPLAQPGSAGFTSNFGFVGCDIGNGTATLTPSGSTISYSTGTGYTAGAGSIPVTKGQCVFVYSDNVNYFAILIAGGGGGTGSTQGPYPLQNCVADQTGNTFQQTATLTNFFYGHFEFVYNPSPGFPIWFNCIIKLPHALPGSGTAKIVIDSLAANDSTSGHTMTFATCDNIVTTTLNLGALTCAGTQNFSTTTTAYAPSTLSFNVQSALTIDSLLVVQIKATAESGLATNVLASSFYLEWQ